MFRLKDSLEEEVRRQAMEQFKQGIEALPATIPSIREVYVGFNINADEQCDICLNSAFSTLEEVKAYSAHPAHRAVAGALMPLVAVRTCVDYEEADK